MICLHFRAHLPRRLKAYDFFKIGHDSSYEDEALNAETLHWVSEECYLPANELFTSLIKKSKGAFSFSLSLSGVLIEQLAHHRPDVLRSFQELHATGGVELLGSSHYHSMTFSASPQEFTRQVKLHEATLKRYFGIAPTAFAESEMLYSDKLASQVEAMGYRTILAEGVPYLLDGRSPNYPYRSPTVEKINTLTRHTSLSDDLGHRLYDGTWKHSPLAPGTFARWCRDSGGDTVNLFLDYPSIRKHTHLDPFDFWGKFPTAWQAVQGKFTTVTGLSNLKPAGIYHCHTSTSWAGTEKDLSPWQDHEMQREAQRKIILLESAVKEKGDPALLHQWASMLTSDHFQEMASPAREHPTAHATPYDAYLSYMNALSDLELRLED